MNQGPCWGKKRISGRGLGGRISVRRRGGGQARSIRSLIRREPAGDHLVLSIDYSPGCQAFVSLVKSSGVEGRTYYRLATKGVGVGSHVWVSSGPGERAPLGEQGTRRLGSRARLRDLPLDQNLHSVELTPGSGAVMARACSVKRLSRDDQWARLILPSGEVRRRSMYCWATLGELHRRVKRPLYKAGQSRWLGKRPSVRGVARNPVDHPHGGGEGKSSGGRRAAMSPWGGVEGVKTSSSRGQRYCIRSRY